RTRVGDRARRALRRDAAGDRQAPRRARACGAGRAREGRSRALLHAGPRPARQRRRLAAALRQLLARAFRRSAPPFARRARNGPMSEERASVRIVDVFDAPRDVVFAAWTEPEQLKRWWGPGIFETVFAEVDLRPGGRYELVLEPGSMRLVGEFREVTPPRRLVYTWRWVA